VFGATILLSSLADVGWDSLVDSLSEASVAGLLLALVVGQTPRFGQALSTIGASPRVLPLGPTTLLQLAITFVNLVIPASAARVATVVRYQQRFGVAAADAVVAGGLDSFAGFAVQAVLLLVSFGFGLSSLHLDLDGAGSGAIQALGIFLVLCVVAGLASLLFGRVRRMVGEGLRSAIDGLRRLRNPQRAVELFGGNLLAEVLFAVTLGLTAQAFGYDLRLADLIAINVAVSLVGGLLPIPGGMGVAESGLSLGLVALGLPEPDALAIALSYRAATFYLPPIWGAAALQWLRRHEYL
jgi:glycosyltransferase 2 family protein